MNEVLTVPEISGESSRDLNQEAQWDAFVLSHAEPHLEQLSCWAQVRALTGWTSETLVIKDGSRIVAGAQILEKRLKGFLRFGYLSRGPLLAPGVDPSRVVRELAGFARERRYQFLAISLPYLGRDLIPHLEANGFRRRPIEMPPSVWARSTLIFDLEKSADQLLMDMSSTTRKHIRRGIRAGVTVRQGTEGDLRRFCELVSALCERRKVSSNMPSEEGVRKMWSLLAPAGLVKLFVAEYQGEPICMMMVLTMGKWARTWRIGWAGGEQKVYSSKVLYWEVLQWAKANGYTFLDIVGIDERDATELLNGRSPQSPFHCSVTQFKVDLGGQITLLPGEWCYFPNPTLRWTFNHGGSALLTHPFFKKLADRAHRMAVPTG